MMASHSEPHLVPTGQGRAIYPRAGGSTSARKAKQRHDGVKLGALRPSKFDHILQHANNNASDTNRQIAMILAG